VPLQDFQVHKPQRDLLKLGPNQQYARRFRPRHPVADGHEIVVGFERDDLGFHPVELYNDECHCKELLKGK
jgi:hypothetical protein